MKSNGAGATHKVIITLSQYSLPGEMVENRLQKEEWEREKGKSRWKWGWGKGRPLLSSSSGYEYMFFNDLEKKNTRESSGVIILEKLFWPPIPPESTQ